MPTESSALPRFAGHPIGLVTLFFTEMQERFSYYGMRAILILYMTAAVSAGGLGWSTMDAAHIYGLYTAGVYFTSIPGGFIADRFLGQRRSVFLGGVVIALGHFSLAFGSLTAFYTGLILIVLGTGLLKPNISVMVGQLYPPGDPRRDAGFSIFYMGINLGAFISPLVCGFLAQDPRFLQLLRSFGIEAQHGWHWGFAAAGVGMALGLVVFVLGRRLLGDAGRNVGAIEEARSAAPARTEDERKRILAIFILFVFSALFWAGFEQAGSSLNLFARDYTENRVLGFEFPSSWLQSANSMFIILLAPVLAWLWITLRDKDPSSPAKFAFGLFFVGLGFVVMAMAAAVAGTGGHVGPGWLMLTYLFHTVGELCLSPVGLSTVTKLAPLRLQGLMMGVWFLSLSLGNYLGGIVAGYFEQLPLPQLFGAVAATSIGAALLLAVLVPFIKKLMVGVR